MRVFPVLLLLVWSLWLFGGCKSKKTSLSGDDPVEIADFIDFFPDRAVPLVVADSTLQKKEKDSLLISSKVFAQFVPDSILAGVFSKNEKPKIYPIGKVKGDETYLLAKAVAGNDRVALVLAFDKKDRFIAAMPLLKMDALPQTQQVSQLDRRFALSKSVVRRNSDGSTSDGKDVYVLNKDAGNFMLIMTEALDDKPAELVNPIDTFSRKQKYTADYGSGRSNLFSFRDGRKGDRLSFFIHFEKSGGECTGELKGEALMRTPTQAIYREPGDPCSLQFTFTSSSVTVKEIEGCGSRRGLRCSFDGVYPRKKEVKPKSGKSSKK